jgi:hypothetical protein
VQRAFDFGLEKQLDAAITKALAQTLNEAYRRGHKHVKEFFTELNNYGKD